MFIKIRFVSRSKSSETTVLFKPSNDFTRTFLFYANIFEKSFYLQFSSQTHRQLKKNDSTLVKINGVKLIKGQSDFFKVNRPTSLSEIKFA